MSNSPELRQLLEAMREDKRPGSCAVIDFDGTLIDGDISETTLVHAQATGQLPRHGDWPRIRGRSWDDDPMTYYRAIADEGDDGIPWGHYPGALLLAQACAGWELARLIAVADEAFDKLTPREDVVALISGLTLMNVDVRILSAGVGWLVRRYVHVHLNPRLLQEGGKPIDLRQVIGVTTVLVDESGNPWTDRQLRGDHGYLTGNGNQTLQITEFVGDGIPFAGGKVGALAEWGMDELLLAAGDGGGDRYLLNRARHAVVVGKGDAAKALAEEITAPHVWRLA